MAVAAQDWCVQEVSLGMLGLIVRTSDAALEDGKKAARETYAMAAHALRSKGVA